MYKEGTIIKQTLGALIKRLDEKDKTIQVQTENGYLYKAKCTFNLPASDSDIIHFEKQTGYSLPIDYKEFLKITNGCRLFDDVNFGGEIELYSLEKMIEIYQLGYDEYEGCYSIANIYQDDIVINSKLVSQNNRNYLFWKGNLDRFEDARSLKMNFELWFDRFIVCQGTKFWWWS